MGNKETVAIWKSTVRMVGCTTVLSVPKHLAEKLELKVKQKVWVSYEGKVKR